MNKYLLIAITILALPGCGGGGGGTITTTAPSLNDYAGVWSVQSAGLPDNQLLIDNAGNVMVSITSTRSESTRYRIGKCSTTGVLDIAGSWPISSTLDRNIDGNGIVAQSKVTLSVTVKDGNTVIASGNLNGTTLDAPPPPPYGLNDIDRYIDLDQPPPVPGYD